MTNKRSAFNKANDVIIEAAKNQNEAADPKYSVYTAASAGTGKTTVLINRILRLLLTGVSIKNILCITFTNAAANEMLERLKSRLENWVLFSESKLISDLEKLTSKSPSKETIKIARNMYGKFLDNLDNLKVLTMHSFCFKILRLSNFIDSSQDLETQIIDNDKKSQFIKEAIDYVFLLSKGNKEIQKSLHTLMDYYDLSTLKQFIEKIIHQKHFFIRYQDKYDNFPELIFDIYETLGAEVGVTKEDIILRYIKTLPDAYLDELNTIALIMLGAKSKTEKSSGYIIKDWVNSSLEKKVQKFEEYSLCFLTKEREKRKKFLTKQFIEQHSQYVEILSDEQLRLEIVYEKISAQITAINTQSFIIFINSILLEYEKIKKKNNLLEYNDLITKAKDLLNDSNNASALLYQLNMSIEHVLVDEAQDLNELQWDIIKLLTEDFFSGLSSKKLNRTLFIVGDYKQSIYGFQGAEPEYFKGIAKIYLEKSLKNNFSWKNVEINCSFRSSQDILQSVDIAFNSSYIANLIADNGAVKHIPAKMSKGKVVILPLDIKEQDYLITEGWKIPSEEDVHDKKKHLIAVNIVNLVSSLLNSKKIIESTGEQIQPSDIMILFRKRSETQFYLISELKKNGIPVAEIDKILLYENLIIQDLISICKFLLLPQDDLNLAALLKSPIIGFTEEELFQVAYGRGEISLWDRAQELFAEKVTYLKYLKENFEYTSISDFFAKILFKDGHFKSIQRRFGYLAKYIIDIFMDVIMRYESTNRSGFESFLLWFSNLGELEVDKEDTLNSLRIMTVHASKGLESPIVIIADASESENTPSESFMWYDNKLFLPCRQNNKNTIINDARSDIRLKERGESLRLLYVAMTRAQEELYIVGGSGKSNKNSWYEILSNSLPWAIDNQFFKTKHEYVKQQKNSYDSVSEIKIEPHFTQQKFQAEKIYATTSEILKSELAVLRGKVIHKLLYELPKIDSANQSEYINVILAQKEYLQLKDKDKIKSSLISIINKYTDIFYGQNHFDEMRVFGKINGKEVNAQIDKIIIKANTIEIIDFKSDLSIDIKEIHRKYAKQLAVYKELLEQKYPNHNIICKVLLVFHGRLLTLDI